MSRHRTTLKTFLKMSNKARSNRDVMRQEWGKIPGVSALFCSTEKDSVCREEVRLLSVQGKNMDQTILLCNCILHIYYEDVQPSALTRCSWTDYIDRYPMCRGTQRLEQETLKFFVFLHAQHICQYNLNP